MYQGAKNIASGNTVLYYPDKERFLEDVPSLFEKGDTILVKASNSMKFSQIVETLKEFGCNGNSPADNSMEKGETL